VQQHLTPGDLRGGRLQDLLLHPLVWVLGAGVVGLALGYQYPGLDLRLFKLLIAGAYLFILVRFPLYVGLGVYLILYTAPTAIWIGSTNFIFVMLITIIWIIRISMRVDPPPRRTYLDWAIIVYLLTHVIASVGISDQHELVKTLNVMRHMTTPIVLFYLIVNVAYSEKRLSFLVQFLTFSMIFVCYTAFMERFFPTVEWMPRWYLATIQYVHIFAGPTAYRISGIFRSHALLSDSAAIVTILQIYLAIRAKDRPWLRAFHWAVAFICLYTISISGNRGGLILFVVGFAYFLVIFSKEISWKRAFIGLLIVATALQVGEMTLAGFEGDPTLLTRMIQTRVERGIPDTRRVVWNWIWPQIWEKPVFGHGPFYDIMEMRVKGVSRWPHNALLYYVWTVGFVGLTSFLYLVWRCIRRTWVGQGLRIGEVSYLRGLTAALHIGIVQFMLGQMRTDHQRPDVFVYFMWIIIGLGILSRDLWEDEKREKEGEVPKVPVTSPLLPHQDPRT